MGALLALVWSPSCRQGPQRFFVPGRRFTQWSSQVNEVHASRLKSYLEASLNEDAILPPVVESEIGMEVQRLPGLVDTDNGLMIQVLWRGFLSRRTLWSRWKKNYVDVPELLLNFLRHKNTPTELAEKARRTLHLS